MYHTTCISLLTYFDRKGKTGEIFFGNLHIVQENIHSKFFGNIVGRTLASVSPASSVELGEIELYEEEEGEEGNEKKDDDVGKNTDGGGGDMEESSLDRLIPV